MAKPLAPIEDGQIKKGVKKLMRRYYNSNPDYEMVMGERGLEPVFCETFHGYCHGERGDEELAKLASEVGRKLSPTRLERLYRKFFLQPYQRKNFHVHGSGEGRQDGVGAR